MLRLGLLGAVVLSTTSIAQSPAPQPPPVPVTSDFIAAALGSDQYEIMAARVALIASQDADVRGFAQHMIEDHQRTTAALQQAATRSNLAPPSPSMSADQARLLGALQSVTGSDFDRAYADQQVLAHQEALTVDGLYASGGADANLRQAAQSAIGTIQQHLAMARQLAARHGA